MGTGEEPIGDVYVLGPRPSTTYDFYIAPRLSPQAQHRTIHLHPRNLRLKDYPRPAKNACVLINRYVNRDAIRWLQQNRATISKISWLLDDDLNAMIRDLTIPFTKKLLPLQTQLHRKALAALVDEMIVSTPRLADLYPEFTTRVLGPIVSFEKRDPRPLNTHMLYYFGKMHGPEHKFLYPIIARALQDNETLHFQVIADGYWGRQWRKLGARLGAKEPRIRVFDEMPYETYVTFMKTLPEGGIFLVPLAQTTLNASRSRAKLLDVAATGSAPLVMDHAAYRNTMARAGLSCIAPQTDDWVREILKLQADHQMAEHCRDQLRGVLEQDYASRTFLA